MQVKPSAPARSRHSSSEIGQCLFQCRRVANSTLSPCDTRYNAWRPRYRRQWNRNYPARRRAAGAWRNPAPYEQARRKSTGRHEGDIYQLHHRRHERICDRTCSIHTRSHASTRECAGARASVRRAHRGSRGSRLRSWRSRDRTFSSRLRWRRRSRHPKEVSGADFREFRGYRRYCRPRIKPFGISRKRTIPLSIRPPQSQASAPVSGEFIRRVS